MEAIRREQERLDFERQDAERRERQRQEEERRERELREGGEFCRPYVPHCNRTHLQLKSVPVNVASRSA